MSKPIVGDDHVRLSSLSFFALLLPHLLVDGSLFAEQNRLVIAHYMTDMVPQTSQPLNRWINPELADPNGSTAALGGISLTVPMASLHLKNADLATAVDFEIRAAKQMGVDGFQFLYPLVPNTAQLARRYNTIIREFIRQSETKHRGFRVSVCLAHPQTANQTTEDERIALWSPSIRALVEPTRDSSAWLRSDSGALLFYLWVGDSLADGVKGMAQTPEQIRKVGAAYEKLARAIGTEIEFVYQVRRPQIDPPYIDAVVKTFYAVWGWTASDENPRFWDYLAKRCREEDCVYTQTVYPDYFTSKVHPRGQDGHVILSTADAIKAGTDGIERHYRVTDLAGTQVKLLQQAIRRDAAIINYATWNDFPEGHHLAPEVNHNFGPSLLLRYLKRRWQGKSPVVDHESAIVFFKKHPSEARPRFSVSVKILSENQDDASEDRIELVTFLKSPARGFLNGQDLGMIDPGMQIHSIPSEPGKVRVRVLRDKEQIIEFETPQAISDAPLRTDRLTYSFSSEFEREFNKLFKH